MSPIAETRQVPGFAAWESPWPFEDARSDLQTTGESLPFRGQTMPQTSQNSTTTWHLACAFDDLSIGAGTCVLVEGEQVAIFRVGLDQVRAVQNLCPHKGAAAMHQGLVGEKAGQVAVFCPLHKRAYSLDDGRCLEEEGVALRSYPVRVVGGMVEVQA
jgi:nitrite reductase (NADH) small subunit